MGWSFEDYDKLTWLDLADLQEVWKVDALGT